jgi:hypothetical protein
MIKKLIKKVIFMHNNLKNKKKELLNIPEGQISLSLSKDEITILLHK